MQIFDDAQKLVNAMPDFQGILDRVIKMSCAADKSAKDDLFKEMEIALTVGSLVLNAMGALVDAGKTVKCGGP